MSDRRVIQKKVCLLGDFAVGKTSLVRRFVEGRFDDRYLSTIGVTISRKVLERDDYRLHLIVWDLASGEALEVLSQRYLLGAAGALLVCDLTRADTLTSIRDYARLLPVRFPECGLVLAGNKADLQGEREVGQAELEIAVQAADCPTLFTSAKTGQGVETAFDLLADQIEKAT